MTNIDKYKANRDLWKASFNKALLIDGAYNVATTGSFGMTLYLDTIKYYIRSKIFNDCSEYLNKNQEPSYITPIACAISAGTAGGVFKYGVTGQNIPAGIINNVGYELCNINQFCNTAVGQSTTVFILETIDPALQTLFTIDALMTQAPKALFFSAMIEVIYTPNDKYTAKMLDCFESDKDTNACMYDISKEALHGSSDHLFDILNYIGSFSQNTSGNEEL